MQTKTVELLEQWPLLGTIPDIHWIHGDDLCDCTFQRIGEWTNAYLGKTLKYRFCCIWAKFAEMFPEYVQDIDASYDYNRHEWVTEPQAWDSPDSDMPLYLWYRQLAQQQKRPLSDIREEYSQRQHERPKALGEAWVEKTVSPDVVERARTARLRLAGWL